MVFYNIKKSLKNKGFWYVKALDFYHIIWYNSFRNTDKDRTLICELQVQKGLKNKAKTTTKR